jgi:hypothetical protein
LDVTGWTSIFSPGHALGNYSRRGLVAFNFCVLAPTLAILEEFTRCAFQNNRVTGKLYGLRNQLWFRKRRRSAHFDGASQRVAQVSQKKRRAQPLVVIVHPFLQIGFYTRRRCIIATRVMLWSHEGEEWTVYMQAWLQVRTYGADGSGIYAFGAPWC